MLPDLVPDYLLKKTTPQFSMNKTRNTRGWEVRVFFGPVLLGDRATFDEICALLHGCVTQFAGFVRDGEE